MQTILEKACQTLAGENKGMGNHGVPEMGSMKDFGSPLNFPSLHDLNLYGGDHHLDHLQQHNMERSSSLDGSFMPNSDNICLGKKRSSPFGGSGKSPLLWSDDLRLQDLGTAAASCLSSQDHDPFKGDGHIQIAHSSIERGPDIDSLGDIYETKPILSGDSMGDKNFESTLGKLERPSPRRGPLSSERINPMMNTGAMSQGRNSPYA